TSFFGTDTSLRVSSSNRVNSLDAVFFFVSDSISNSTISLGLFLMLFTLFLLECLVSVKHFSTSLYKRGEGRTICPIDCGDFHCGKPLQKLIRRNAPVALIHN